MSTAIHDMQSRWVPSADQIAAAASFFKANAAAETVYTVHVLIGKTWGIWTLDVRVTPVNGLFTRAGALKAAAEYQKLAETASGKPCTAGFAVHYADGEWAVFEA